jgi:predicted DCC family thiol-disulfide oxidoreductase YuxK
MPDATPPSPLPAPPKAVLVFDGECALCASWVARVGRRAGDQLECVPSQDPSLSARFPNLDRGQLDQRVHLIEPDGCVHSGAQAVLRTPGGGRLQAVTRWLCGRSPVFTRATEWAYRWVAKHRRTFSRVLSKQRRG